MHDEMRPTGQGNRIGTDGSEDDSVVRTLIVDDSRETRQVLTTLATSAGAHVTGQAASAEEALAWLERYDCDLVMTDYQMPGMRGVQLVEAIKSRRPTIRVALISILDDHDLETGARRAGADWVLSKPVSLDLLEEMVRSAKSHGSRLTRGLADTLGGGA